MCLIAHSLYAGEEKLFAKKTTYDLPVLYIYNFDRPTLIDMDDIPVPMLNSNKDKREYIDKRQAIAIGMPAGTHTMKFYTLNNQLYKTLQVRVADKWQYHYDLSKNAYTTWDKLIAWIEPFFIQDPNNTWFYAPSMFYKYPIARESQQSVPAKKVSTVDINIPSARTKNEDTYVLIIANENYENLSRVSYAANDGQIFKQYCIQTLGIPEKQIRYYADASYGKIVGAVDWLAYALNNFSGAKGIVYYCGHGIPDEKTGQAYLIPADGKGTNTSTCYSLNKLYSTLSATKAESITYFMDACFTGANKEGDMLVAARGVALKPKAETLTGKSIVFSASSNDETAMTLEEEGHGLFTYYLLKKLQDSKGNATYAELADYINKNVKKDAFLINDKPQTPTVTTSQAVEATWKTMKLK